MKLYRQETGRCTGIDLDNLKRIETIILKILKDEKLSLSESVEVFNAIIVDIENKNPIVM